MICKLRMLSCLGLVVALSSAASVVAADWGTIKGKFVYEGKADAKPIQPSKDTEYCGKHKLVDETIVLGDGNALQNVFVYLYLARGKKVEIAPDYKSGEQQPKVLENKNCHFVPHAITVWTEQPFHVTNADPGIGHNTNAPLLTNPDFNEQVPNDKPIEKKFEKSEPLPSKFACNIHPWMNAYVLIRDNPYMAVSGEDGSFEIKNVPAGKQDFVFWHEAKGNLRDLMVGKQKADRKGQVQLTVPAGETLDLGEIKVAAKILGK